MTGMPLETLTLAMLTDPLPWALDRIRAAGRHGRIPLYGSPDWAALPARDPRRWAAVIAAAEAWRDHRSPERISIEIRQALQDEDARLISRMKDAAVDVSSATDWTSHAARPTHAELERRRAVVA